MVFFKMLFSPMSFFYIYVILRTLKLLHYPCHSSLLALALRVWLQFHEVFFCFCCCCCLIIRAFSVCTHKKARWCVQLTIVVEIKLQQHHFIHLDVPFLFRWCVYSGEVWLVPIGFSLFFFFIFILLFLPQITYWLWKKLYQPFNFCFFWFNSSSLNCNFFCLYWFFLIGFYFLFYP